MVNESKTLAMINLDRTSHHSQGSEEYDVLRLFSEPHHLFCEGICTSQFSTHTGSIYGRDKGLENMSTPNDLPIAREFHVEEDSEGFTLGISES